MTKKANKIAAVLCALCVACAAAVFAGCSESGSPACSTYTIAAELDAESKTLTASATIDYVNRTDVELGEVWFHLYPAAYRDGARYTPVSSSETGSAYPGGVSYGGIEITAVDGGTYEIGGLDEDILKVTLPQSILPTQSARVTVEYKLTLPRIRHRFGYENGTFNLGNWFPIECAYAGGFSDAPYYSNGDPFQLPVCDYDVTITAPASLTVAMPGESSRSEADGKATTHCALRRARDFAAVLGEFQSVSASAGGVDVTYYYKNDADAQKHLQAACDALSYFSQSFGAYPYKTYAVVQTPFNQGGMEYTGLVYVSDAVTGDMITEVIVHETAHQWWYGIVGNDQVNHAWLDEALAEYSTTLFYEHNPDYGVKYADRIADAMGGFSLFCELSRTDDTSMDRGLGDFASASEYTYMTYVKGQLMYDSLRTLIGEDALVAGLRSYASTYAFATATPDDLVAALESSSHRSLQSVMASFIDGTSKLYGSESGVK